MDSIHDVRALLTRQQADKLALEKTFKATPIGTEEFGKLQRQIQQQDRDIQATGKRLKRLLTGSQSPLF
jgi:DNA-binding PadR family transcriptional regulator